MSLKSDLLCAASLNKRNAAEQERRALWYITEGHVGIAEDLRRNARQLREVARRQGKIAGKLKGGK